MTNKFKVTIKATVYQHRYINAASAEEAKAIVEGECDIDLNDAEYDYDEDDGEEEVLSVVELKQ